ncbi:hypothetical protein EI42_04760 [Thermosporothrix hazakensis]|jgi:hypothetical protein|uniref:Uncharacterized protein n=1 Tax=Thermosporothrix hazakensis TaxID=644383 RepID=A0A326U0V8_THEHA|nr:hypothetical protein [Thermosporothrix hazakensis]PZW24069.1 hypothetical protein EI42_04760 [Thermosporothrix hazakensis]GCE50281.1 hypothetical protein KTH_51500 [Thermosporothrix hazakensis]
MQKFVAWIVKYCYPRAWREQYERELLTALRMQPVSLRTLINLFGGCLMAHLMHPGICY